MSERNMQGVAFATIPKATACERVLAAVRELGPVRFRPLCRHLGVSASNYSGAPVDRALRLLKEQGAVQFRYTEGWSVTAP